jgi:hypothetical protein
MNTPIDAKVAFFTHLGARGRNMPVREILDGMKSGQWASKEIAKLRTDGRESPGYEKRKTRLPSFTLSATTNGGRKAADVIEHSGLIQVDVDKVGQTAAPDLRDRLSKDRHILAAWISPSGDGVKAAFCVLAVLAGHKAAFQAVADYLWEKYAVKIDPACSDVSRQCFVSHDPGLVLNEACQPLAVASAQAGLGRGPGGEGSSLSLHPLSSILYNKGGFFTEWPRLLPIYNRHVSNLFPDPQPGHRNQILSAMVPRLMSIVKEDFVMGFALEYYHQHAAIFSDYPFEKYTAEAACLIRGCLDSYPGKLGAASKAAYLGLSDPLDRAAFRICQSLAQYTEEPDYPPPLFCLSCQQLAIRLGLFHPQAQRILQALRKQGIIEEVQRGQRYDSKNPPPKGTRLKASVFRWLPDETGSPRLPPCHP